MMYYLKGVRTETLCSSNSTVMSGQVVTLAEGFYQWPIIVAIYWHTG